MKLPNLRSFERHELGVILENPARMSEVGYDRLLNAFLRGRSKQTRKAYSEDLCELAKFLDCPSVQVGLRFFFSEGPGFANEIALGFRSHLLELKRSPATVNRKLASLRSLVKMARTVGLVSWSLEVENVRSEAYRNTSGPGVAAVSEVAAMLSLEHTPKAIRDLAIVRLLFDLGLRRGEVCSLDFEDVQLAEGKIQVIGKGKREKTTLSLPAATREALARWIEARGTASGPFFTNFDRAKKGSRVTGTSIYRIVSALGDAIGTEMRPHGLRHTAITEACLAAAEHRIPIEEIKHFSRHSRLETVLIYRDRTADRQGQFAELVSRTVARAK